MDKAVGDGRDTCKKQGRHFVMLTHKSTYQGMDRTAKGMVGILADRPTYGSGSSHDDYRVEITFKCK